MRYSLFLFFLAFFPSIASAGKFTNEIEYADGWFLEDGSPTAADDPDRLRLITIGVGYTDNRGDNWEVPEGNLTDGASIPWYVRWVVGGKFETEFERPSALHDHYVTFDHRVRPAFNTHRMFYDALLDEGVDIAKANAMYLAVATFGASWKTLQEGQPCDRFKDCVRMADDNYSSIEYFAGAPFSEERLEALKRIVEGIDADTDPSELTKIATETRRSLSLPMGDQQ